MALKEIDENGKPLRPAPTRGIPAWQQWAVGILALVLIGVPFLILWAKFVIWLLGL